MAAKNYDEWGRLTHKPVILKTTTPIIVIVM